MSSWRTFQHCELIVQGEVKIEKRKTKRNGGNEENQSSRLDRSGLVGAERKANNHQLTEQGDLLQ